MYIQIQNNMKTICKLVFSTLLILVISACSLSLDDFIPVGQTPETPDVPVLPSPTAQPVADVIFEMVLQVPLPAGGEPVLSILDEVTGLAMNAQKYPLRARDPLHYTVRLPLAVNSVIKYRYELQGGFFALEDTPADKPVRYRLVQVVGPADVQDIVAGWTGIPFEGPTGRITGEVIDSQTELPVPGIMISASGQQVMTDSRGRYILEGVPPGTHNLVAYALDGMYTTYQQGATVAEGLETFAPLRLQTAPMVNVIFTAIVPRNTVQNAPVRVAGNLIQFGNSFGDLDGGLSSVASRMPVMNILPDGRYTLSINLPVGADIRYKYTLGDGFWNAEHVSGGGFKLRQLIVPSTNIVIQDTIETWESGPSSPIMFEVTVPENTPVGDRISIQFNPYGWTEPIPMWPLGNNRWVYRVYSPLNMLGNFGYRFCRNEQCGSADDIVSAGSNPLGRRVNTSLTPQDIQEEVNDWVWMQGERQTLTVTTQVTRRQEGFLAGIEFQPSYEPGWLPWYPSAYLNIQALNANLIVLTPTWTISQSSPLVFGPVAGKDALWYDMIQAVGLARAINLNVAIFPSPHLPAAAQDWWDAAPRDEVWWRMWFESYRSFAIHHADMASKTNAQMLVLGGDWLGPALPGGTLKDGSTSGVPIDADDRWLSIIKEVRNHFSGPVYWAMPYPGELKNTPDFLKDVDGFYLLWYAPLGQDARPSIDSMRVEAGRRLDTDIQPFIQSSGKPVVLAPVYPSISGTAVACLPNANDGCHHWMRLSRPRDDIETINLDLQAQSDVYQALLIAVNERSWISGFVSRGYYPPVSLLDKSASVHGKPVADYLWYWYPRWLGLAE